MATPVHDSVSNYEETVQRFARVVGKSAFQQKLFAELYSRAKNARSVEEIMEAAEISKSGKQRTRNVLNKFANKGLIQRVPTGSKTKGDGIRMRYRRYDHYMGLKQDVLKFATNTKEREKLPTKRTAKVSVVAKATTRARKAKAKLRLLFLTAAPEAETYLRTDAETRMVLEQLRGAKYRDRVTLEIRPAADLQTILDGINDVRPHVVHFSGHANRHGLWLDDGKVEGSVGSALSYGDLTEALEATDYPPTLIVLNACQSDAGTTALSKVVDAVVGMNDSISDLGAAVFSSRFYAAIAAGQSLQSAHKQAIVALKSASPDDAKLPQLFCRAGVNAKKITLVS